MISIADIRAMARDGGWKLDVCERVMRMGELLAAIASHAVLRDTLALKGGTAINTINHALPRLSVDLDFNYIGTATGDDLAAARTEIVAALHAVSTRLALTPQMVRSAHGGSKLRMTYRGIVGSGRVEVDLNFLHRVPLLEPRRVDIQVTNAIDAPDVLAISAPELAAGKLSALLDRTHPRDVWDTALLAVDGGFDAVTRRCFIVYLASARTHWRALLARPLAMTASDAQRLLVPMLRGDERPADVDAFTTDLIERVERAIAPLRTPTAGEIAFLDAVAERGEVDPGLLQINSDDPMHDAILRSPALAWKARNVAARGKPPGS